MSQRTPGRSGIIDIRVRYSECDPMGFAHHTAYPVWFEMGRTELLRASGMTYRDLEADGVFLAVVALAVRYRRPARYDDPLQLETTLRSGSRVKVEHGYRLLRNGELLTTADTVLACLDHRGRPRLLPDSLAGLVASI